MVSSEFSFLLSREARAWFVLIKRAAVRTNIIPLTLLKKMLGAPDSWNVRKMMDWE